MNKKGRISNCVPADAVRVWRGFRTKEMSLEDFLLKSGEIFLPAGVLMQAGLGLQAYIPAFPAGKEDKPDTVPDETAILFWEDRQTYYEAFKTLAGRVYTLSHGALYQMPPSTAAFPVLLTDSFNREQPYYLFDNAADWMSGSVRHLVGGRPPATAPEDFPAGIFKHMKTIQSSNLKGMDGVIVCAGNDYVAYWEHWADEAGINNSLVEELAAMTDVALFKKALPVTIPAGLWDKWQGMDVKSGDCFNFRFERRNGT